MKDIRDLQQEACGITGEPRPVEFTDDVVALVEYRDGALLMLSAKLRNNLLTTRDLRQLRLDEILRVTENTVIQLALNIPGERKCPPGAERLMLWGDEQIRDIFPYLMQLHSETDGLGPWRVYMTPVPAKEAKYQCCSIEQSRPFARLLDIDVYTASGKLVDRTMLQLDQRRCLICKEDAKECIRLGRHSRSESMPVCSNCSQLSQLELLAKGLIDGLKAELYLTPKPGLVDLNNCGSHQDLDLVRMNCSIALMRDYLSELCSALEQGRGWQDLVYLGQKPNCVC